MVPPALLATGSTAVPPSPAPPPHDAAPAEVFFLADGHLYPVARYVLRPPTLTEVLAALDAGPDAFELRQGVTSALGSNATLQVVGIHDGVATIELAPSFDAISGQQAVELLAQTVYTATGVPGVHAVQFEYDGAPVLAVLPDFQLVNRPVTRQDYEALAPA
jgi:spore germination protein GerM